ncbi:MAG: hypothetical protein M3R15_34685, partial [Acidobacteriota bacterium]|nr:hypothetical protein [Acidobacteriota bacterium]
MERLQPASFDEFTDAAACGNVVPVVRRIPADLQTPVGAFLRLRGASRYAFLLESVQGGESLARYTFLGAEPEMIVRGRGRTTYVERDGTTTVHEATPVNVFLRNHFRGHKLALREN